MKRSLRLLVVLVLCLLAGSDSSAQIIINGRNPYRRSHNGPSQQAISIAYGFILWKDVKNVPLAGYSVSRSDLQVFGNQGGLGKYAYAYGLRAGYDVSLSEHFVLKASFFSARMKTGVDTRLDLEITKDKSRFTQLGVYGSYSLTQNLQHRLQFQLIAGPELEFAKRDLVVVGYVLTDEETAADYHQDVSVVEGALVGGLGISLRLADHFTLFTETLGGLSFPGKGIKLTTTGVGLKVNF